MGNDNRLARHGHVSYLEIPAAQIEQSAAFYEAVFGWKIDRRSDSRASFDDGSGDLAGSLVTGRAPSQEPGLMAYIYVNNIKQIAERIASLGGQIVRPPYPEGDLWVATFRDPAGNLMGVWQFASDA